MDALSLFVEGEEAVIGVEREVPAPADRHFYRMPSTWKNTSPIDTMLEILRLEKRDSEEGSFLTFSAGAHVLLPLLAIIGAISILGEIGLLIAGAVLGLIAQPFWKRYQESISKFSSAAKESGHTPWRYLFLMIRFQFGTAVWGGGINARGDHKRIRVSHLRRTLDHARARHLERRWWKKIEYLSGALPPSFILNCQSPITRPLALFRIRLLIWRISRIAKRYARDDREVLDTIARFYETLLIVYRSRSTYSCYSSAHNCYG